MKKILITIFVLATGDHYDMLLPIEMNMIDAINLIQKSVYELSGEEYVIKEDKDILLYTDEGKLINTNNIVKISGLKNGSHVLMA